jgi:type 1 glutamine amidotransferase
MGDDEYRSEESMPMLAKILERELSAKVTLCYPVDSNGYINPSTKHNIINLQKLNTADLMVMYCRFRALPDQQLNYILEYVESGKPIVGFRTTTHAFQYHNDKSKEYLNYEWPQKVFGQQWVTHHGHFDDGANPLTSVFLKDDNHKILTGVKPFEAYSWLYHVDGGDWKLYGDSKPILFGKALKTNHEKELNKFPLENPVAWTKSYTTKNGKTSKVFFTTLGHPYDFKNENMRRLAINGIYWSLGIEDKITEKINVTPVTTFDPNNSGMEHNYRKGVRPNY